MTSDPALLHPATLNVKAPEVFQVKFATTKGDFVVEVTRAWAPLGADRFYNLVKHGYFHGRRILPQHTGLYGAIWVERGPGGQQGLA